MCVFLCRCRFKSCSLHRGRFVRNRTLSANDSAPTDLVVYPPRATDDWPYVYHRTHSIPRTYWTISTILLAMAVFLVGGVLEPGKISRWHFFFLGASFLLLETQLVSRLAPYFADSDSARVSREKPKRLGLYYGSLVVFLLGNYFFPGMRSHTEPAKLEFCSASLTQSNFFCRHHLHRVFSWACREICRLWGKYRRSCCRRIGTKCLVHLWHEGFTDLRCVLLRRIWLCGLPDG